MNRTIHTHIAKVCRFVALCLAGALLAGCAQTTGDTASGTNAGGAGDGAVSDAESPQAAEAGLTVVFMNTGKSDCILLRTPEVCVLIDAADEDDYARIKDELARCGAQRIDALCVSHYDKDHIGSAGLLLRDFPVGEVYGPDYTEDSAYYRALESAAKSRGVPFIKPENDTREELSLGKEGRLTLYAPKLPEYDNDNEYSLIMELTYEGRRFLFTGDALKKRMKEFDGDQDALKEAYDVVKLPHHGDYYKELKNFMESTAVDICVVCADADRATVEDKLVELLDGEEIPTFYTGDGTLRMNVRDGELTYTTDAPDE